MPRAPRGGSWAAEYARRLRQTQGLPKAVARGHGPVPARIARGIEGQIAGRPRALPVTTQIRYREGIGAYEKRYRGGLRTGHTVSLIFPSKRAAELYVKTFLNIDEESSYVEIEGEGNQWTVTLLR